MRPKQVSAYGLTAAMLLEADRKARTRRNEIDLETRNRARLGRFERKIEERQNLLAERRERERLANVEYVNRALRRERARLQ